MWIAIYDGNAVDLIDSVSVPALKDDCSFAREKDGSVKWEIKSPAEVTPGTNNLLKEGESKVAKLKREDPYGFGIAILSMGIVFSCLCLALCFLPCFGYIHVSQADHQEGKEHTACKGCRSCRRGDRRDWTQDKSDIEGTVCSRRVLIKRSILP